LEVILALLNLVLIYFSATPEIQQRLNVNLLATIVDRFNHLNITQLYRSILTAEGLRSIVRNSAGLDGMTI
jgi:hypothetical protein